MFISSTFSGIYLWEFSVSFHFDWAIFTRQQAFRWTLIPYFLARYTCLIALLALAIPSNMLGPIGDCKIWWQVLHVAASFALLASSLLLIIRVVAVAAFNRWIAGFFGVFWFTEAGTVLYGITLIDGVDVPPLLMCAPNNVSRSERIGLLMCFALYLCCLSVLAFSLRRSRGLGVWRLLLSHGVVYFAVATLAFGSTTALLLLDLNDGTNMMIEQPALVALVICATRLYRGLVMYRSSGVDTFILTTATLHFQWASHHRECDTTAGPSRGHDPAAKVTVVSSGPGSDAVDAAV
ncbi:hypothetical protein AURDEDRAFT_116767 [Auricularia subglabra TFB-10046 SS5]|uniref:Uncharacterized protein n=1 Tax=Auricularia subglabra (strain TFB-10046 / SS5) TaxID=717982 RepID=J0WUF6_AURST|nr:hypothetical protein AURDEDRAFT_116767 [Auricularia subglabra TFB-10046 SS5]